MPDAAGCTLQCAWGCVAAPSPHCAVLQPSGGGVGSGDVNATGVTGTIDLSGKVDGDTGEITGLRGSGTGVANNIDFEMRGNIAMFRFAGRHVAGTVSLAGGHPIAFVADQGITVDALGTLDRTPATGGGGDCTGGSGAAGAAITGAVGLNGNPGGGGGGAVGWIRINTHSGSLAGATLSPAPSDPMTTCSVATATVK
jgi:hypothetical protein